VSITSFDRNSCIAQNDVSKERRGQFTERGGRTKGEPGKTCPSELLKVHLASMSCEREIRAIRREENEVGRKKRKLEKPKRKRRKQLSCAAQLVRLGPSNEDGHRCGPSQTAERNAERRAETRMGGQEKKQ